MDKSSEHLTIYLERILSFLISNDDSLVFPSSLTMAIEDILVDIIKDKNFLKQSTLSDDCQSLAEKLTVLLDKTKDVFTLDYEFKFDDKRKKVMVYKKIPVRAFQETVIVPSKPLRKPNVIKENVEDNTPKSVMSSFKITFLNATLKFVKDDSQMVLSYPNMSTEQADFVKLMIHQCMERDGTKAGFKGLYDPLAEALKIFSLKFDFKLHEETLEDMKKLRFEKTRKNSDTIKREETRIIYEETTDSDSSSKHVGKSKTQRKLTTLTTAITEITPAFKLRTLTELRDFLKNQSLDNHTFSNLSVHEQQFISHWQALTQRVEVMKLLDVQGKMLLDEIRGCLKKKNYRVKVELGMTSSENRFAKLTKVLNPNNKLAEEEMAARLEAMVLATKTRRAACAGQSSSGDSSSDSNSKPKTKFESKIANFLRKTNRVKNDWIQATLTQLRSFLQDEAEASLVIRSITELQAAFLAKWQNFLTRPEVIKAYPTDVQVLMYDVRDVAAANKKKYRVEFSLTKHKNGIRGATFAKLPAFSAVPTNTKLPENIVPKVNGNKVEIAEQKPASPKPTNLTASVKIDPKKRGNKDEDSSEKITAPKTTSIPPPENNEAKEISKKDEKAVEPAAPAPKKKKIVAPGTFETKQSGDKAKSSANATKPRPQAPIPKSTSLTSLNQKKRSSKNASKVVKLPTATVKLIEALNQPLVSERGLKMMRQMGWEGGPLGVRGEGLAEPLMPELDLKKRAGLGAPKPNIQALVAASKSTEDVVKGEDVVNSVDKDLENGQLLKPNTQVSVAASKSTDNVGIGEGVDNSVNNDMKKGQLLKPNTPVPVAASKSTDDVVMGQAVDNSVDNDLKKVVMRTLFSMVTGEESMKTVIKCKLELTMQDWNYITNIANMFNNRGQFNEDMSAILQRVTDDELMLTVSLSWAKTEILLILSKYNEEIKINRNQWFYVATVNNTLSKTNRRKLVERSAARNVDKRVMVTGQAFKYYVMAQILDFCSNCNAESPSTKEVTKDIILKGMMVKKQLSYVRDVVTRVNSSAPCASSYAHDIDMHNEIIKAMHGKGYKMSVEFPSLDEIDGKPVHKIISLTKTYGYRTKTVLIKKPLVKTEEITRSNNCSTQENKSIQFSTDIIEIDIQEPMKKEPKYSTKNTKITENKENNIQNSTASSSINKDSDKTIMDDNMNEIISSLTEINIAENTDSKRLSKRIRPIALSSDTVSSDRGHKRTKYDYVKHINIEPKDYPRTKMTKDMAAEIQKSIQQSIDYTQVLPLLKCHGIQDGVLSYSCHNEKSLEIILNVVKPLDFYVTLTEESEKSTCRMSIKLNTFIDEGVESIFKNLETFNLGLSTKDWVFIKKEQYSDFIVIFVDMDLDSYKFIRGEHFKLYVGIDEARFSIV